MILTKAGLQHTDFQAMKRSKSYSTATYHTQT